MVLGAVPAAAGEDGTVTISVTISGNATAVISRSGYDDVTFSGDGSSVSGSFEAVVGEQFTVTVTPDSGYMLDAMTYNNTASSDTTYTYTASSGAAELNITITEMPSLTVRVTGSGTVTTIPSDTSAVMPGTVVQFQATASSGYVLKSGSLKASTGTAITYNSSTGYWEMTMPREDVIVTAEFSAAKVHQITVHTSYENENSVYTEGTDGGTVSVTYNSSSTDRAFPGAAIKVTASPSDGYTVSSISVMGASGTVATVEGSTTLTFSMPSEDVTVNVYFAIDTSIAHTVTVKSASDEEGTVYITDDTLAETDVTSGSYVPGTEIWIVADAADGYTLNYMTTSPSVYAFSDSSGNTYSTVYYYAYKFVMPKTDVTITAYFTKEASTSSEEASEGKYTITMASSSGGFVNVSATKAAEGEKVNITAVPDDGYVFAGWESTGGGEFEDPTAEYTQFTMPAGNVTLIAKFEKQGDESDSEQDSSDSVSSEDSVDATGSRIPWLTLGIIAVCAAAAVFVAALIIDKHPFGHSGGRGPGQKGGSSGEQQDEEPESVYDDDDS
ncbi:MAG: InlB B-repeat-containing protein [Oscillospiraceae bacterium]